MASTAVTSRVSDILSNKGSNVYTIGKEKTVFDAVKKMAGEGVGCLVVTEGKEIAGIVTERDYLRKVILMGRSSKTAGVSEIMTTDVICVGPEQTVEECMAIMSEKRIRHLPVMQGKKLTGIVSIGDLIKQISKDQKVTIRYLTEYISDRYPA